MLPRAYRLPSSEIKFVMQRGRRVSADAVQLVVSPNVLPVSRFAFVVPISVDKHAVVRNRMRRLLRESARLALPGVSGGWDGVFLVRKKLPDALTAVDNLIQELLKKVGFLNESIIP